MRGRRRIGRDLVKNHDLRCLTSSPCTDDGGDDSRNDSGDDSIKQRRPMTNSGGDVATSVANVDLAHSEELEIKNSLVLNLGKELSSGISTRDNHLLFNAERYLLELIERENNDPKLCRRALGWPSK